MTLVIALAIASNAGARVRNRAGQLCLFVCAIQPRPPQLAIYREHQFGAGAGHGAQIDGGLVLALAVNGEQIIVLRARPDDGEPTPSASVTYGLYAVPRFAFTQVTH